MAKWITNVKVTFDRCFPERQIYHRSGGIVRYISISPWQQAMCAVGAAAFTGWSIFATGAFILDGATAPAAGTPGATADAAGTKTEQFVKDIRAKETVTRALLEGRTNALANENVELEERTKALEGLFDQLSSDEDLEISALSGDGAALLVRASIDEADFRQSREAPIITAAAKTGETRVSANGIEVAQHRMLEMAEERAIEQTERARGVLALTTVGTDRIMANVDTSGQGGPLAPVSLLTAGKGVTVSGTAFFNRLAQTQARIAEMQHYQSIIASLPLSRPVGVPYRHTSPFGLRVDPFTKRPATHAGIDLAAFRDAPIIASGPGTISFAGVKSGYGRLVEIDHGNGFKSRYGHLRSITVLEGASVATGDLVGRMGTTGRSTGDHLHYEVLFNSKQHDPVHFLKAGRHVHKKQ
jgi:murein DD-endopeptidase MepM/ murein hydrolase activator NlpD